MSLKGTLAPQYKVLSAEVESDPNLLTVVFLALVDIMRDVSLFNFRHKLEFSGLY